MDMGLLGFAGRIGKGGLARGTSVILGQVQIVSYGEYHEFFEHNRYNDFMDAHELHAKKSGSILDKLAADPGLINRPMHGPATGLTSPAEQLAAAKLAPPVILLHPDEHLPASAPAKGHKLVLLIVSTAIFLMVSGGGAAIYFKLQPAPAVVSVATASPVPTPTPAPTDDPTPSPLPTGSIPYNTPTPTPTPPPTPVPATADVSAPAAAPSAAHPQSVTVTNPSGLWLRSSPDSSKRSNIITWMPNGAKVSVNGIGSFWWHGTYDGKTGYFAVSYTK
jgi:hypothetical protein